MGKWWPATARRCGAASMRRRASRRSTWSARGPRRTTSASGRRCRSCFVWAVPNDLPDRARWAKLKAVGVAISETTRNGKPCSDVRYYILSRRLSAERFGNAVRSHSAIEHRLHWQLDVTFQEDLCRVRKGHADTNLSRLRRTALSLLKNNHTLKIGIKNKRLAAAWNENYLQEILFGK